MNQTVTIGVRGGQDSYGDPTYGAAVSAKARVQLRSALASTPDGTDLVTATKLFLPAGTPIGRQDRVTLPSGEAVTVTEIYAVPDGEGITHHLEVMCSD